MYRITPFKDKNNKPIFCGDLLKYGDTIKPIYWYYSCYVWNNQIVGSIPKDNELQFDILQTTNMENLGNIYSVGEQYGFNANGFVPFYGYNNTEIFEGLKVAYKANDIILVKEDIDILDLKSKIVMTKQGHTFKLDPSIIIYK